MEKTVLAALGADGPAADRVERMALYGWLIGSWRMEAIVTLADGRQPFTAITPDSFLWLGERKPEGAGAWRLQAEFHARRVAA